MTEAQHMNKDDLIAENARLSSLLQERYDDVRLVDFDVKTGEVRLQGSIMEHMAEFMAQVLEGYKPEGPSTVNYAEIEMHHPRLGRLTLGLQRCAGKTPHQLRLQAEEERDRLRVVLDAFQNYRAPADTPADAAASDTHGDGDVSLATMRQEVADDLYNSATSDSGFRRSLIDDRMRDVPDRDIWQMWVDAGLDEKYDGPDEDEDEDDDDGDET